QEDLGRVGRTLYKPGRLVGRRIRRNSKPGLLHCRRKMGGREPRRAARYRSGDGPEGGAGGTRSPVGKGRRGRVGNAQEEPAAVGQETAVSEISLTPREGTEMARLALTKHKTLT